jgi:hypothetical protein
MNSLNLQENAILDPTSPHLTDKKNLKWVKEGGSISEDGFEERGDLHHRCSRNVGERRQGRKLT